MNGLDHGAAGTRLLQIVFKSVLPVRRLESFETVEELERLDFGRNCLLLFACSLQGSLASACW